MTWKSALALVLALAAAAGAVWMFSENRALFETPVVVAPPLLPGQEGPITVPVGLALLLAFVLGVVVVVAAWTRERMQRGLDAIAERRSARARRRQETAYREALEALLDGRPERALELLRELLQREPGHGAALMTQADVLRSVGRAGDAVEVRERRLEDDPDDLAALYALADDHRARGDLRLAAATLERVLRLHPRRAIAAARRLREVLIEAGESERALDAHRRLVEMGGGDEEGADARIRAGLETRHALAVAREGRAREASTLLKKVLRRRPDHVPAILALAEVHLLEGREGEALEAWLEGYQRTRDPAILVAAERHHDESRHHGDEVERAHATLTAFQRFVAVSDGAAHARAFLGKLYTRLEMLDEAAAEFDAVRTEFPDNPTFTYYAARIAEKRGRHVEAAAWYRGILKALDVLRLRWRCGSCGSEASQPADRCGSCLRWGSVGLESDVPRLERPLPAAQPVYEPREADSDEGDEDLLLTPRPEPVTDGTTP